MTPPNTITHSSAIADIRRLIAAGTNQKTKPPELVAFLHDLKSRRQNVPR